MEKPPTEGAPEHRGGVILVTRILTLTVFVAMLVLGWRFAGSNAGPVSVNYLAGEFSDVALWMALLVSFALGAASVGLFAALSRARASLVARRYRKTVAGLEAEVHQLRNLPLTSEPAELSGDLGAGGDPAARGSA